MTKNPIQGAKGTEDRTESDIKSRGHQQSTAKSTRWDPGFAEKFGLLRDKGTPPSDQPQSESPKDPAGAKKRHWDTDSDGLSDADSSTSRCNDDKGQPQPPLPPWLQPQSIKAPPEQTCQLGLPPLTTELLSTLSEEIVIFAQWAMLRDWELKERDYVQTQLSHWVQELWPSAKMELFGSTACGLALPSSDLDLVITGIKDFNPLFPLPHLIKLSRQLQIHGISDFSIIPNAKVPLIKYCHPRAHVWVDVTFTVMNSTKCIPVVKGFVEKYPLIRPMAVMIKTLLRQNGLHKPHEGGLGSYALILLLYSFMRLRSNGVDVQNPANVGPLTVDFLRYFASHGTDCPYTPGAQEHPIDTSRRCNGRLEVWDPLDQNNNVAFTCRRVEQIQAIFGVAVDSLAWYSPRHCCSVLGAFISAHDPNLRMQAPATPLPVEHQQMTDKAGRSAEGTGEEGMGSGSQCATPGPQQQHKWDAGVLGHKASLDVKLGAVMGSDLESQLLLQLQHRAAKGFVNAAAIERDG